MLSAIVGRLVAAAALLVLTAASAIAQTQAPATLATEDDWGVGIYPIFAWVPLGIDIDVEVPPFEGGAAALAPSSIAASMVRSWEGVPLPRVASGLTPTSLSSTTNSRTGPSP